MVATIRDMQYSSWCYTADISQSQITWSRKHTMMPSFLGLWMTLLLSIFGTALHLHWCLSPTVLLRKSLIITVYIALMSYSGAIWCSSWDLHFGLQHIHTRNLSIGTQNECIADFLQTKCGGKNTSIIVYIYILFTKACAGATISASMLT